MRVLAGVVLYNPPSSSCSLLESLKMQGCTVSIIVNALDNEEDISIYSKISDFCSFPGENIGLANALNSIIRIFQSEDFDFLFLFDQDSQISDGYVANMINEYSSISDVDNKIACLGPRLSDVKFPASHSSLYSPINYAIYNKRWMTVATSGSLFTQSSFRRVGLMDHNLFIDGIDHDWCLRAWKQDRSIYVSSQSILIHDMGNAFIKFGSILKPIHSNPIRHYYIVRNSLYMIFWKEFPVQWKILEGLKTIRRIFGYPLLSPKKIRSFKMVLLGLIHGTIKRLGKLSSIPH